MDLCPWQMLDPQSALCGRGYTFLSLSSLDVHPHTTLNIFLSISHIKCPSFLRFHNESAKFLQGLQT